MHLFRVEKIYFCSGRPTIRRNKEPNSKLALQRARTLLSQFIMSTALIWNAEDFARRSQRWNRLRSELSVLLPEKATGHWKYWCVDSYHCGTVQALYYVVTYLFVYLFIRLFIYLFVYLFVYLFIFIFIYLCIYLSIFYLLFVITFVHCIYTYIPATNHVSRQYSVAAILYLLFMVHITLFTLLNLLYFYISTLLGMCAVPNMAVFCSSLILCFAGTLLKYFLNDFERVQVNPIIIVITFLFIFHIKCAVFIL